MIHALASATNLTVYHLFVGLVLALVGLMVIGIIVDAIRGGD